MQSEKEEDKRLRQGPGMEERKGDPITSDKNAYHITFNLPKKKKKISICQCIHYNTQLCMYNL